MREGSELDSDGFGSRERKEEKASESPWLEGFSVGLDSSAE